MNFVVLGGKFKDFLGRSYRIVISESEARRSDEHALGRLVRRSCSRYRDKCVLEDLVFGAGLFQAFAQIGDLRNCKPLVLGEHNRLRFGQLLG